MAKAFVRWAGGKTSLLPQIMEFKPHEYNKYLEPFVGGGAVFFRLELETAVLSDINKELINLYTVVRNKVDDLIEELKPHENSKEYYYMLREADRDDKYGLWSDVDKASRTLYLNKTCWNGLYRVNSKGYFNVPFGDRKNPNIVDEDTLYKCSKALQNAMIISFSFENILDFIDKGDFIYLDPPYAPLSETSFTSYTKEDFGKEDQLKLKEVCDEIDSLGGYFMLSNSHVPFIVDLYSDYNINVVLAPRYINSVGDKRGGVEEVIVTNYKTEKKQKDWWE